MTRNRSVAASFLTLSAAAVLALTGAGGAAAAPAGSDDKATPSVYSAKVDSTGAANYWTADRMRAALPGDLLADKSLERGNKSSTVSAEKAKVKATKPKGTSGKPTIAQPASGMNHVGKIFFTLDGADYVCSGNAVKSANQSTVATAAHCLFGGTAEPTRFIFVPGYYNGTSPHGSYEGVSYHLPSGWKDGGNMAFDTGFVVVKPGREAPANTPPLSQIVDESDVLFNAPRGLTYQAFGYPADSPFDGGSLKTCTGTGTPDTNNAQFATQGIPCDMTGGSSGGPWFIQTANGLVQTSVNSYGYNPHPVMYGPQWGADIKAAYDKAVVAPLR
ncbi:trypsin-like serine peptidase [Pseudarthrobacter sp. DSP2-3-2b1]|uniref:trypsin-like serine peptidase n=1 Tax=Pseudarthrobacter sp. DSP2-3-2b1 TaxID=2804661 RepID=UPI003CF083D6